LATVNAWTWFGQKIPRVSRIMTHLDKTRWDMDVGIAVGLSGLKQAD
jgi:hypothetical protein